MGNLPGLYIKLITEHQQAQTDKLVWSPEIQKAFKALQAVFLQAPTLSLPTGSEFSSLLKKRLRSHSLRLTATIVSLMPKVKSLLMRKILL